MTTETKDTTHNGWRNYETWAVNLWLTNDAGSSEYWAEAAADQMRRARMFPHNVFTVSEDARYQLADMLKDEITDLAPSLEGVYADLLNAALSEVEWSEIANAWLECVPDSGYEAQS